MRVLVALLLTLSLSSVARAEDPSAETLEEAKRLFHQGNELRNAGQCERALPFFVRSRKLVPSVPNILNGAVCLAELGRYDEALVDYETLLTDFRKELTQEEYDVIGDAMTKLRAKTGSVDAVANVDGGKLLIDGRERGELPLVTAFPVLPGAHDVRVVKDGYEAYSARVEVKIGETVRVDAALKPIIDAGVLRVDDPGLAGAEVSVDGAIVGTAPWEGALSPGAHYLVVRRGDEGSAPVAAVVVKGQVAIVRLELAKLGPVLSITADPRSAALTIGDVAVGHGKWRGRLPLGEHQVTAREEGYRDLEERVVVKESGPTKLDLALTIDESHPRWGGDPGHFWLDAYGGFAITPGFSSGMETSCDAGFTCDGSSLGLGSLVAVRVGYEFPVGLTLEVLGGWMYSRVKLSRSLAVNAALSDDPAAAPTPLSYDLSDRIRFSGAFIGAGLGWRFVLADPLELRASAAVGTVIANMRDTVTGSASDGTRSAPIVVGGSGASAGSADLFAMPELHLGLRFGGFAVSAGVSVPIFLLEGPQNGYGALRVAEPCRREESSLGCAQERGETVDELSYGRFVSIVPSLRLGYSFEL